MVATRSKLFKKQASPFELQPTVDPGSDTMVNQAGIETVFIDHGWKNATLTRLCDVEDLLDSLEACGVKEREVEMGQDSYAVRWR